MVDANLRKLFLLILLLSFSCFCEASSKLSKWQKQKEQQEKPVQVVEQEQQNSTQLEESNAGEAGQNDDPDFLDTDPPRCTIAFRPESNFDYFDVEQVEPNVYFVPFDKREKTYNGNDKVLAEVFANGRPVAPYARIYCQASYVMAFKFNGVESLRFFRLWPERKIRRTDGSYTIIHSFGAEILLTLSTTGEYVVHSVDNPNGLKTSYFIFTERDKQPYLLGYQTQQYGYVNQADGRLVVPCIISNPNMSVALFWESADDDFHTAFYIPIFNSSQPGNQQISYDPKLGFLLSTNDAYFHKLFSSNGAKRSSEFPYGNYKCQTKYEGDAVYVSVVREELRPPPPTYTSEDLSFQLIPSPGNKTAATCTGRRGTFVKLIKLNVNHHEGLAYLKCLAERYSARTYCGSSFHNRQDGETSFQENVSTLADIQDAPLMSLLFCKSNWGETDHVFYFKGLSGRVYTKKWQDVPTTELLETRIEKFKDGIASGNGLRLLPRDDGQLYSRDYIQVYAKAAGDIISHISTFIKYKNNETLEYRQEVWDPAGYAGLIQVTSRMDQLICNVQQWDSNVPIITRTKLNVKYKPCEPKYFECVAAETCLPASYQCDKDNDCGNNADEDPVFCEPEYKRRTPVVRPGYDVHPNRFEFVTLACRATYQKYSDYPSFRWFRGEEEIQPPKGNWLQEKENTKQTNLTEGHQTQESNHALSVFTVNATDNADYKCVATNKFGSAFTIFRVIVHDPCQTQPQPTQPSTTSAPPPPPPSVPTNKPNRPPHEAATSPTSTVPPPPGPPAEQVEPFRCTGVGKYPDPENCVIYHECVEYQNGGYLDYQFACGLGTVYCPEEKICGFPRDCPCNTKVIVY